MSGRWTAFLWIPLALLGGCVRGASEYNRAVEAFQRKEYSKAREGFEKAVAANSDFAEAWYNLGATKVHLAKLALRDAKRSEALGFYREAVGHLRRAKELMDQGSFTVYSEPTERDRLRKEAESRLQEHGAIVGDDEAVLAALRALEE